MRTTKNALQEQFRGWEELEEYYARAEDLKAQGETEITLPIAVFLRGKEARRSMEKFCGQLLRAARSCSARK